MSEKPILSVSISSNLFQKLKREIKPREVSQFVEKAIAKELGEYEEKVTAEYKEFQQKIIAGYKKSARSKALKKESKI